MNEHQEILKEFDGELATMCPTERANFDKALAEIRATLVRYPGVGLMAVAYVSTDECAKREDLQS